ncbi:hypothetical protein ACIP98_37950 [Streptomyces sp. NPDC088354]|uniref:hypothetical protein n=1 Tax=Streptomyces sp. NPDC088354 TaxID=3365856 RepID=UPI0038142333
MFEAEERERVRERLLALAVADPEVVGAAVTGSEALGAADRWSDLDLAFAVDGERGPVLERWTSTLYEDFSARHHWDLPSGSTLYRVFLLPGWLEVDLAFTPADEFGPLGPAWRTVFGSTVPRPRGEPPGRSHLVGLAWHHALHARTSIERERYWQAEYWISAVRDQVIALACRRLGHPSGYAKAAHLLPGDVTAPLHDTLIRSLDDQELRRALDAVLTALAGELERADDAPAGWLLPMLAELADG